MRLCHDRAGTMNPDLLQIQHVFDEAECLHSESEVEAAIDRIAAQLNGRLKDRAPLLYCVMNGGLVFAGRLLPRLHFPLQVDYLHATRYRAATSGGELVWKVHPEQSPKGRCVVILDDILDEGHTLAAIVNYCKEAGAEEVLTAALVDKQHDRKAYPGMRCDFTGLDVADRFLFGYGMDYKGFWRNAPGIYAVKGL